PDRGRRFGGGAGGPALGLRCRRRGSGGGGPAVRRTATCPHRRVPSALSCGPALPYSRRVLRVALLGELTVEVDGHDVELPRAWRARPVLGWLALHPGTHPRASVAARFWPDVVDGTARASLRNALWSLRRSAGAALLEASRERVGLAASVWVDAVAFAELDEAGSLEDAE